MNRRWRPSLGFVLGGALCGTLGLSLTGLVIYRYLGPAIGFGNAAILLGAGIVLATFLLGWLLVRLLLRPIRALEAYADALERGEQDAPPPSHFGTQELHSTARQVMAMAQALRDRETSIRSYSDHVTHELKTPIATVRAAAELLQDGGNLTEGDQQLLAQIDGARQQAEAQLAALQSAARARETRYLGTTKLNDAADAVRAEFSSVTIDVVGGAAMIPLALEGVLVILRQLIGNAAEHGAQTVTLKAERQEGGMVLQIKDDGGGISAGNVDRVFEPFFTTRRETGGTGMGLAIVRNVLAAHGAEISLIEQQMGTAFEIRFSS